MHILRAQVMLDRAGFSPGVIDGHAGQLLGRAVAAFQTASGLPSTGRLGQESWERLDRPGVPETVAIRISEEDARGPFVRSIPRRMMAMARLRWLGYASLAEMLAERFHTTPATLAQLNRGKPLAAGATILVPNVRTDAETGARARAIAEAPAGAPGANVQATYVESPAGPAGPADAAVAALTPAQLEARARWQRTLDGLSVAAEQPSAAKVVVDRSDRTVQAFDAAGRLIGHFPATIGSGRDPLPLGHWRINSLHPLPTFNYNPKLFWDAPRGDRRATLAPGPNNPVGVMWIDLSKEHYGIHGTPEPANISRTASHGCIRLTNWDAARLAQMLRPGTPAILQP